MTHDSSFVYTPPSWLDPLPLADMFGRQAPLEVDVGCGKGRFLVTRATKFPDHNFLGIERQLVRIIKVNRKLLAAGVGNARLLHLEADYSIRRLLPPESVTTFYIFFPDPWPKRKHHGRRLLQQAFIENLLSTLRPGGCMHLATDHLDYFNSALKLLKAHPGFEQIESFVPTDEERTEFEAIFTSQGLPIGRCSFRKRAL